MATWYNWSPLAPLIEKYTDDGTRDLCAMKTSVDGIGDFEVSIVGTKQSVELIRVATLNSDGNLSPQQNEVVSKLIDHTLTILKLTYNNDVDLVRWGESTISIGAHDVDGKPLLGISISDVVGARADLPLRTIEKVLAASLEYRVLFRLLADAQAWLLPLQYRYLSLYKILELEFRVSGKWLGLEQLLEPYHADYYALNISARSLPNLIHEMRDKCAHIKVGGNDSLGIVGLENPDAKVVKVLVDLLSRILSDHLNKKAMGVIFVHSSQAPHPTNEIQR